MTGAIEMSHENNNSIRHLILTHFDAHQRCIEENKDYGDDESLSPNKNQRQTRSKYRYSNGDVNRRAHLIRRDISAYVLTKNGANNDEENVAPPPAASTSTSKCSGGKRQSVEQDISNVTTKMSSLAVIDDTQEEISSSILQCVQSSFVEIVTRAVSVSPSKENWEESIDRMLELAVVLSCNMKDAHAHDGYTINKLINWVCEHCVNANIDNVRMKACYFLDLCLKSLQCRSIHRDSNNNKSNSKKTNNVTTATTSKESSSSSSDLWKKNCVKKICNVLHPRITDKTLTVRIAAIKASKHIFRKSTTTTTTATSSKSTMIKQFFEIEKFSKPLLRDLVRRLNHDSTIACRVEALQSVPICKKMIQYIIDRTRDIKEKVRLTALDVLAKIDIHLLTIEQRCSVLQSGLTNRCDATHDATIKLISGGWMKSAKFDPIIFLQLLDVPNNEKIIELAMREIISIVVHHDDKTTTQDDNNNKIKAERRLKEFSDAEIIALKDNILCPMDLTIKGFINPEYILFMHSRCAEINKCSKSLNITQRQELIGELMYDVPTLIEALEEHLKCYIDTTNNPIIEDDNDNEEKTSLEDSHWFVCIQLLRLVEYADLQEAGSRRCFTASLHNILCNLDTPDGLVEEVIKAFKYAYSTNSDSDFMDAIAEMIQYITDEAALNWSPDNKEGFNDEDEDFSSSKAANHISLPLNSHLRIVNILSNVLEHLSSKSTNTSVWDKFLHPIVTATTNSNHQLREIGVACLGRFALLSDGTTVNAEIMPCLQTIANNDVEVIEVRAKASMAICDLILLHDSELSSNLEDFSSLLFRLFENEETGFICVASEICVKLLLAGTLKDEAIIARLLLIYFSDTYDDEKDEEDVDDITEIGSIVRLQQLLSMFFPAYSMKSVENRDIITKSIKVVLSLSHKDLRKQKNAVKSNVELTQKIIDYTFTVIDMGEQHMASFKARNEVEDNVKEEEEEVMTSNLPTMIIILDFLIENGNLPTTYLRALCKIVCEVTFSGKEEKKQVRRFHQQVEEIEDILYDKTALNLIQKLYDTLQPLESEDEEESKNVVDETMISQIANISLIGPNNDDCTVEIKNLSLNVTNINDSSDIQNITSVSDNIMLDEELHDEDFEL